MPHCPSYEEMDNLDKLLEKSPIARPLFLHEVALVRAVIADNKQMRKHLAKLNQEKKQCPTCQNSSK